MKYRHIWLLVLLLSAGFVFAQTLTDLDTIQRLAAQGEQETALESLEARIIANPNDIQARFLKGLLLLEQGDNFAAREIFAEITRLFPQSPEAHNNLAAVYAQQGEYELAREALLQAIATMPDYPPAQANLGDLYTKLAADAYREAFRLNPGDEASRAKLRLLEQLFANGG